MMLFLKKNKVYALYGFISLIAIVWNVLTMEHSIPWCDEVMLADTPATMHFYGEWSTTAFNAMGEGSKPFSVYLPLYTWVLYAWISVLGFSFLKVRLCELLTAVILGGAMLNLGRQISNKNLSLFSVLFFSLGFWFTDLLLETYRLARPDILGALMTVFFAIYVVKHIKSSRRYTWQLILFSALSLAAGIQSGIFLVFGLIFAAIFIRPLKIVTHPVICCVLGFIIGMAIVSFYMACFGELKAFIVSIMNSSGSVMKLWGVAREFVFPLLGKEVTPIVYPAGSDIPFYSKLMDIFAYVGTTILFVLNVLLLLVNQVWNNTKKKKLPIIVFLYSVFVVLCFNIAGRYPGYYMWTAVLPMLLSLLLWMNNDLEKRTVNCSLVGVAVVCITAMSLSLFPLTGETPCDRINAFIEKRHFEATDKIAAPFSTFYALKPTNKNTYFYQVYPQDLIEDLDYIIIPQNANDYNIKGMHEFLNKRMNDTDYIVKKVGVMRNPDMVVYRCYRRNK